MIVLDTNVLSELMKEEPVPAVISWFEKLVPDVLFTTAITEAEVLYGIELLPADKRKNKLRIAAKQVFDEDFAERVLAFDNRAARAYAQIVAKRRALGRPISQSDAQIAAIVQINSASLATRDVHGFDDCGIQVVNPWT